VNGEKQTEFVKRLQQAGKQVEHYLVQATDENRHGVVIYSRVALAGCLRDDSTDVIAQQIQKMVDRRVAATNREPERRNDGSRDAPTAFGDVHNQLGSETPRVVQPPKDVAPAAPETVHR